MEMDEYCASFLKALFLLQISLKGREKENGEGDQGWMWDWRSVCDAASRLLVLVQQGHSGEGFRAVLALVLFDVRVRLQVGPEVGSVGERTAAVRTRERLLAWNKKR